MSKNYFITSLDVGTSNIKLLVANQKSKQEKMEIAARVSVPSAGVRKGVVTNIEEVSKSIIQAVDEAQKIIGHKIKNVYCSIGGSHIFVIQGQGRVAVSRADETVSKEDIARAVEAARACPLPQNKEIIDVLPKDFVLDGEGGIRDVEGMKGIRLEAHALLLGGFVPYIKNLKKAVSESDLGIDDLILSPLAVSESVLTRRQKELGVAVVDIGASTTSLAVFEEGNLIHVSVIPIGSSHITNDIAIVFKIDIDLAEQIKLEFGTALYQSSGKREIIDLSENLEEPLSFTKRELSEIIESRLSEIFDMVNKELKAIFKAQLLPAGIILTGGGSRLPKLKDFAKKELKLPVQLGYIEAFTDPLEDPSFAVCAGLILFSQGESGEKNMISNDNGFWQKFKKFLKMFKP